jgi:hypothetical protein
MRMRFRKDEKAAFTKGTAVEWRNGRHWHPGEIIDGVVHRPYGTIEHILVRNKARTGTSVGFDVIHAEPTAIRLPTE